MYQICPEVSLCYQDRYSSFPYSPWFSLIHSPKARNLKHLQFPCHPTQESQYRKKVKSSHRIRLWFLQGFAKMWNQPYGKTDVEAGATPLYPMMFESPELRWSFIRKVYSIISIQLLATIAVASVVVSVRPISQFFVSSSGGLALYIVLIITPFIGMCVFVFVLKNYSFSSVLILIWWNLVNGF